MVKVFSEALLLINGRGYLENGLKDLVRSRNLLKNVTLFGNIPEYRIFWYKQQTYLS